MKVKPETKTHGEIKLFLGSLFFLTILFSALAFSYAQAKIFKNSGNSSTVEKAVIGGQSSGQEADAIIATAAGSTDPAQLFVYDGFGNCLPRRANGHFIINLGSVVYVQIKGDATHPITDSQLTSTSPVQTITLAIQWSSPRGTSHKITFLQVPVVGTGSNRATASVPWIAGNFSSNYTSLLPAGISLPAPAFVSSSLSDTSGTVVTASELAAIVNQCTLAVRYGNPSNMSFVLPSDPPFSSTCGSTFGTTSGKAPNPIGHMNWNSSACEGRDCPTCPTGITPTMVTSGTQTTLSIQDPLPGITYTWSLSAGTIQGTNIGTSIIWTAPTVTVGTAVMVEIIASNPATGCIAQACKYTITVNPNNGCPNISVTVVASPSSATICAGGRVFLFASATGGVGPYTFTWSPSTGLNRAGGGETITTEDTTAEAATDGTITGPNVVASPAVTTVYTVVATDANGCSGTSMVTVFVNTAPVVTESPTDQEVCAGETATFTAEASGIPDPMIQWQVSIDGGLTFSDLPNENSNTLTVQTTAMQNGYKYRAKFTNDCGMATTDAATLTVNTAPTITTDPLSLTVCLGSPATFTVVANGTNLSYQWYRNNDAVFGATSSSLTIPAASLANTGSYYVVVSNECGSVTSNTATLGVFDFTVSISPQDRTVQSGGTATYTVSANLVSGSTGAPTGVSFGAIMGLPADAKVSGFPSSLNFGSSATFSIQTNTLGDFTFTVEGSAGTCSRTATANLYVFDFTVGVTPDSQTVLRGCSKSYDVAVNLVEKSSTFDLPKVSLSVVFADQSTTNITASFGTASSTPPFITKLFLSPDEKSSLGEFKFVVVGTVEGGESRQSFVSSLKVYDFNISATPNPLVLAQNQQGSYTVTVKLESGSATPPPIGLSVSLPSGITGKLTNTSIVPTLDGAQTYLLISPTPPAITLPTGNFKVTITGTDPGDASCFRTATLDLTVVAARIGGKMRDTGCNDIPNGFDAVFTPAGSSLKLNATNPGGFMYNSNVTVDTASKVTVVLSIPTDPDDAPYLKGLPSGSASFVLYGSRPVHVYTSDPCAPGAVDITPNNVVVYTPTGSAMLQPLSNNSTPVTTLGSVVIPDFNVPAGGKIWVQVHIRSALLDTTGWPLNSQTAFLRSYQFRAGFTFDNLSLSTQLLTNFTGTGKRVTGIGGYAVDLNGSGKGGLKVVVSDTKGNTVATATTEKYSGFFFAPLPANTSGSEQLFNAMDNQIGSQKFGPIAQDLFVQLDFLNLSPADPVIEGIVGTVDKGLANTRVELLNVAGHVVSTTQTNSGGYYIFRFPAPGSYTVRVTPPDGFRAATTSTTVKVKMFEEAKIDFLLER
jgi:hypothetical protein